MACRASSSYKILNWQKTSDIFYKRQVQGALIVGLKSDIRKHLTKTYIITLAIAFEKARSHPDEDRGS